VCEHVFVPWAPTYTRDEAQAAIEGATSWRDALTAIGRQYHGKNIATLRKWAARWGISTAHLSDYREANRGRRRPRYSDAELAEAVEQSLSWAETLRRLGYCPSGGNWRTLRRRTAELGISTDHFDPYAASRRRSRGDAVPLEEILVEGSNYNRSHLKQRLYDVGLKRPVCELCGQGELWNGRRMSLILDHINGVRDDNRLENLRIACPNCAATLETHCGRSARIVREPKCCLHCDREFVPRTPRQKYCSRECGSRWDRRGRKRPGARRAQRPPREQLLAEIAEFGYLATGRRYGVSDNAIRIWIREYERELAVASGRDPGAVEIPKRTWPNRRDQPTLLDDAA
jgi:transposase-like protein